MENSFLRDAIDRIVELARPYTLSTNDGHRYSNVDLYEVKPEVELPARYSVDTLEALVKLIRTEGIDQSPRLYVRVDSARRVMVDTTYTHARKLEPVTLDLTEGETDALLRIESAGYYNFRVRMLDPADTNEVIAESSLTTRDLFDAAKRLYINKDDLAAYKAEVKGKRDQERARQEEAGK